MSSWSDTISPIHKGCHLILCEEHEMDEAGLPPGLYFQKNLFAQARFKNIPKSLVLSVGFVIEDGIVILKIGE